jgi:enolase-phosphatase E1
MTKSKPIRHVLLDIEGTTCPVTFVSEVLFPYARRQLMPFLREHQNEARVQRLLAEINTAWQNDPAMEDATRRAMATGSPPVSPDPLEPIGEYLDWLIQTDRKITPLKDLQGMIWEEGYQRGQLVAPLFAEVPEVLRQWHGQGIQLAIYSSGSVQAQKLLYSHTKIGDLSHLFSHWFDTRTGPKNQPASYETIALALQAKPEEVLFVSDAVAELEAASQAGMAVVFSQRAGNPQQDPQGYEKVDDLRLLKL